MMRRPAQPHRTGSVFFFSCIPGFHHGQWEKSQARTMMVSHWGSGVGCEDQSSRRGKTNGEEVEAKLSHLHFVINPPSSSFIGPGSSNKMSLQNLPLLQSV